MGALPWPSVPIRFQIYGNITVLARAAHLSNVRPIYLLALSAGCHTDATPPARAAASASITVFLSLQLPVCLNITIQSCKNAFSNTALLHKCHPCPGSISRSGHVEVRFVWGFFFFFWRWGEESGPSTLSPYTHINTHVHTQTWDWIPLSPSTMYRCAPKHKVLTWEDLPASLQAALAAKPHSSSSCHFLHLLHWRGFTWLYWGIYLAFLWWNITQRHRALLSYVSYLWSPSCHYVMSACGFCFTPQRCLLLQRAAAGGNSLCPRKTSNGVLMWTLAPKYCVRTDWSRLSHQEKWTGPFNSQHKHLRTVTFASH